MKIVTYKDLKVSNMSKIFHTTLLPLFLTLFLCIAQFCSVFGQAPGYLGKRFFIEGNVGTNLSIFNYEIDNDNGFSNVYHPMAKLSVNWVTKRHRYLSLEANYRQSFLNDRSSIRLPGADELTYQVHHKSIAFCSYKTNRKRYNSIAPLGAFFGYKYIFSQLQAIPIRNAITQEPLDAIEQAAYYVYQRKATNYYLGLALSYGRRIILKDRFTLNYMIDFGFNVNLPFSTDSEILDDRAKVIGASELRTTNGLILNVSVGAGYLM